VLFRTCHLTDSVCRCYSAIWNLLRPMSCNCAVVSEVMNFSVPQNGENFWSS